MSANRSELLNAFAEITTQQASISTKGRSDAAVAIRELNRRGVVTFENVIYTIKREDGRYLAVIDGPYSHGFYGAPTKHAGMEWLVRKLNVSFLPLCKCCENRLHDGEIECGGCEDSKYDREDSDGGDE